MSDRSELGLPGYSTFVCVRASQFERGIFLSWTCARHEREVGSTLRTLEAIHQSQRWVQLPER